MKKYKIVIADDNIEFRGTIRQILERHDRFEIVGEAGSGVETLEMIKIHAPDMLLLDIVMPNLDGFEVLNRINAVTTEKPKIICMTQLSADEYIEKAINLGCDYIMVKPINYSSLISKIDELLNSADFQSDAKWKLTSMPQNPVNATASKTYNMHLNRSLDERLSNIFISVGIPAHIKGYQFLREAIKQTIENPSIINSITKQLYPRIADIYNTSSSKVERAIRHAIEVAWNRGRIENINEVFGIKIYDSNDRPTNGEFIALVADKMLIERA